MRCSSHGMRRLAAAGDTCEWKMFRGVAPNDLALLPRDTENLRARAMDVDYGLRTQVADAGLEADPPLGRDNEKSVEAGRAADVATERYANAAHLCSDPLRITTYFFAPFELLRAAIERLLEECAGCVLQLALHRRSVLRFALRTVEAADGHLVGSQLARGFGDER